MMGLEAKVAAPQEPEDARQIKESGNCFTNMCSMVRGGEVTIPLGQELGRFGTVSE